MPLPETEHPGRLQAELISRGLRMTRQRRTILSVVETAQQHLDASQLLRRARKIDPGIDRVTVYRTLKLLKRDRKSTRLNSSHRCISYAVFCLKKKKNIYCNNF